ncbi:asparaginase [Halomonas urumqiensis]|uniref:L-asparaginase 1 n=1 Tax=Halomonas urumqiensis TaxID=1684789 RepID=A0A2N7UPV8_9GAMM|nr:asparaginase [Halomonas urumqiensis]PMR82467.1 L-asparaginase 1 [Halomonas urumqiensis]PTB04052.1 asparaginase [Halomonas urumqiensis]GHE19688.1 L-asparaginase 1 [Halomonas urumqiensis]
MPPLNSTDRPLLVLYTGGTLGMLQTTRGLSPGGDIGVRLERALTTLPPSRQASLPPYRLISVTTPIDSSAATPLDWQRLGREIADRLPDHAGVVVLHGTDTLAWSAASLAYQLQGVDRPVVLTGAMQPLEAEGSDALANVELALRFAANPSLKEVAIAFGGRLLRGVRARKWHTRKNSAFESPNYPLLGERVDEDAVLYPTRGLAHQQRGAPRFELPDYTSLADGGVARIALWPGISARQVAAWLSDPHLRGALLEVWGGGNSPDDPALLETLARASGEGKLLAAISQCPHGGITLGHYAAGQGLVDAGVLSGDDMTPEAALTKLIHLLAQPLSEQEQRQRFLTSLSGER